jgi:hypothetical protein
MISFLTSPDHPGEAQFLGQDEKETIEQRLVRNQAGKIQSATIRRIASGYTNMASGVTYSLHNDPEWSDYNFLCYSDSQLWL